MRLLNGEKKVKLAAAAAERGVNVEGAITYNYNENTIETMKAGTLFGVGSSTTTTTNITTGESTEVKRVGLHLGGGIGKGASAAIGFFLGWENIVEIK